MLPLASTAGAQPACQIAACPPLGAVLNAMTCCSVVALYPTNQPYQVLKSPCDPNPTYTTPLTNSNPSRCSCSLGVKVIPGTVGCITVGPPNFSAPVVRLRACSRYT